VYGVASRVAGRGGDGSSILALSEGITLPKYQIEAARKANERAIAQEPDLLPLCRGCRDPQVGQ
jgi:hypothetical protein